MLRFDLFLQNLKLPLCLSLLFLLIKNIHLIPLLNLPSNTVDSSVNSLNSSYDSRIKPLSFKTKPLVPKSLALFKTSVFINSSVKRTVSNGAVS